eukprot:TRINITY_DN4292_c0_g1_i1.p1 TRINITY_DN4292_c0_g1~~TRINITY_DN4292_c0_g1_i1.p1  ORF type:complete len:811 (+),score=80.96 TRINITY_DN4292_c0_g1_i1:201-2633(+)
MPAPQHKAHKPKGKATKAKKARQAKLGLSHRQSVKSPRMTDKQSRYENVKRMRDLKREELLATRRHPQVPITCALLPLSHIVNCQQVWDTLIETFKSDENQNKENELGEEEGGMMEVSASHHPMQTELIQISHGRQRTTLFMVPPPQDLHNPLQIIQITRCASLVLFVMDDCEEKQAIDDVGEMILSVLCGIGMPSIMSLVNMQGTSAKLKDRSKAKLSAIKAVQSRTAQEPKTFPISNRQDVRQLIRSLVELRPTIPHWRRQRPSVVLQDAEFDGQGTLALHGYVQGCALSANQLITLPGIGDKQISKIVIHRNQFLSRNSSAQSNMPNIDSNEIILQPGPDQHDDAKFNDTGSDIAESEDMDMVESMYSGKRLIKRKLPTGTSDYQAAWYPEDWDDAESDEGGEEEGDDGSAPQAVGMDGFECDMGFDDIENDDGMTAITYAETEMDVDMEQAKQEEKVKRAKEDQEFPDEMDTPKDIPARQRFQKYRNLESLRTSKWDTKENLPKDYAQIFAFENFKRTMKAAKQWQHKADFEANVRVPSGNIQIDEHMQDENSDNYASVKPGIFVKIYIDQVPPQQAQQLLQKIKASQSKQTPPVTVFGLLHHESKITQAHFTIRRHHSYTDVIANKEELFFIVGGRGFRAKPIISRDAHNSDKFKMERFIHDDSHYVVSVYAPICFPPMPVLAFKLVDGQVPKLACTGSVKSCDPDRVVLKKIVLSGYPKKIHKSTSVIKYMFFNPEDVKWFKPVELWTKYGKRGRIKDSIGTHGTMKCVFNEPLTSNDTVCMSLYKRVFPKRWQDDETYANDEP